MSWTLFLSAHLYWLLVVEGIFIVIFAVVKSQEIIRKEDAEIAVRNGMTYDETNHTYTTVNRHTAKNRKDSSLNMKKGRAPRPTKVKTIHSTTKQTEGSQHRNLYDYQDYGEWDEDTYEGLYSRRYKK